MTETHIEIAIPTPVPGTFSYTYDQPILPGTRVLVPFGPRKVVGVVMGNKSCDGVPDEKAQTYKLKSVAEIIDPTPIYSPVLLEIARWLSRYYLHPIGEVLRTMLPVGVKRTKTSDLLLSPKGEKALANKDDQDPLIGLLGFVFAKKKSLGRTVVVQKIKKYASQNGDNAFKVDDLMKAGFIQTTSRSQLKARTFQSANDQGDGVVDPTEPLPLTAAQKEVFDALIRDGIAADSSKKPFLLWGLTGSGKTEVYLQVIAEVFRVGSLKGDRPQILVLVPEISLTPQMTRVFENRFPGLVAVVHSAMADNQRWDELEKIRSGSARILIGPRSAVFAPFLQLGLVIVDEEHDSSYKQSTGLTYNGRDVAIVRGNLEGIPVILGSATPSMETYFNAVSGKYHFLKLTERVSGRPLPIVEIVPSELKGRRRQGTQVSLGGEGDNEAHIPVASDILNALRENLAQKRQAMVIVNRRGYAYYLFSITKKKAVSCPQCSISLTVHGRSALLRCHYCDYQTTVKKILEESPQEEFATVGYGSQQAEEFLRQQLPEARLVRIDSDTVTNKDVLPTTLEEFRQGKIDILVGTQILAKGHDFANVTLVVLLEVDQIMNLPDFRAGERAFQLIVQAAGRAGRAGLPGKVLIQAHRGDHPIVQTAVRQDFLGFAESEIMFRKDMGYPPFSRMIAVEYTAERIDGLNQFSGEIEKWLEGLAWHEPALKQNVHILGPGIPPIETIRGRVRRTLIFTATDVKILWNLVQRFLVTFKKTPKDIRLKVDVDPQSMI